MEIDILDSLEDLGYSEIQIDEVTLKKIIQDGLNSTEYTDLVSWLTKEIQVICKLEEAVNTIKNADDVGSFVLELNSFLKELGCPHPTLMQGQIKERLPTYESRLLLLDYLCGELMAARISFINNPNDAQMKVEMSESNNAKNLKNLLITLGFPKPPATITPEQLFGKVETKIKEIVTRTSPAVIGKPLFNGVLTQKQWHTFAKLQEQMQNEYKIRRELLIKRMDITIESFLWGEEAKKKADQIAQVHNAKKKPLTIEPNVRLSDVLAAREDLLHEEKTSSANVRANTKSKVNNVIIGRVPDRGGRPEDQQPPPPEMPSWQKRTEPAGGGRGGGFGGGGRGGGGSDRGGGRGGRVQGNWSNQGDQTNFKGSWDKGGGANYTQGGYQQQGDYQQGGYQQGGYQQGGYQQGGYQQGGYQQAAYQDSGYQTQGAYYDDRQQRSGGGGRGGGRGGRNRGGQSGYYDAAGSYGSGGYQRH